MYYSVDDLLGIRELPEFLRSENCFNDMQHAMLVILFRRGLESLCEKKMGCVDKMFDVATLYLYIHFLNEEEGMAFQMEEGLVTRDEMIKHSESHLSFLDYWSEHVLFPHKKQETSTEQTIDNVVTFYNLIIKHIEHTDIPTYGSNAVTVEQTRRELARIANTSMPMSPFMSGAYDVVKLLNPEVATCLDASRLGQTALSSLEKKLNLVPNVGRILKGSCGSLRDRFADQTGGDPTAAIGAAKIYA
ncbi:hypothetical protein [Magnetovibrio sp.]|uniref:hypothetical protein n=1 Tax=Magnetovibrio sp. TaxID=2024836 RepID=UPI002F95EB92